MVVHLVDGTYELFRHFYAVPSRRDERGQEIGAVRGVLNSIRGMRSGGATHIGVATDHVIESFRNELWPGYKTSAGIEPDLLSQFPLIRASRRSASARRTRTSRSASAAPASCRKIACAARSETKPA